METQYSLRLVKNVFLEIDHRYTPINTDNTDASFMGGWVVIGLLSISHDLLVPLLIHITRLVFSKDTHTNASPLLTANQDN
ncbi:hypothetical protein NIES592_13875 [Fischerella major NIES-592]|uniref:Uncharacterized protein n=1 Tax=Fischerella major NIES-592 TaxID=210994 RepID=A0A1U7GZ93_9CYAN|nr:hypothetical protein [Fischerella major]OKH13688.1 hypothetical protein NIES592_13875 [Fischerella major NIES-592]